MGKRKNGPDHIKHPIPSDSTSSQHAPLVDLQSVQRSSEPAESSAAQHPPVVVEAVSGSMESLPAHFSGRSKLSKHSQHPGRHYSRRGSSNHIGASPSYWNGPTPYDAKVSLKPGSKNLLDFHYGGLQGVRTFVKPERIRSETFSRTAVFGNAGNMECGLCQKRLKKSPCVSEQDGSHSSNDVSVVAVLVCGHAYHADCLEQRTDVEHKHDPPCPLCLGQALLVGAA